MVIINRGRAIIETEKDLLEKWECLTECSFIKNRKDIKFPLAVRLIECPDPSIRGCDYWKIEDFDIIKNELTKIIEEELKNSQKMLDKLNEM